MEKFQGKLENTRVSSYKEGLLKGVDSSNTTPLNSPIKLDFKRYRSYCHEGQEYKGKAVEKSSTVFVGGFGDNKQAWEL